MSMLDTRVNPRAYPQPQTQKPSLGYPLAHIGVIFYLACEVNLELGLCHYAGKGQSELTLLCFYGTFSAPKMLC
jgi:hypothetical protein